MKAIFSVNYDLCVDKSKTFLQGSNTLTVFSEKDAEDAVKKARKFLQGKEVTLSGQNQADGTPKTGTVTDFKLLGVSLVALAAIE